MLMAQRIVSMAGSNVAAMGGLAYNPATMSAIQFTATNGQSLAQGHNGGMNETLTQQFASKAFPSNKTTTVFTDLISTVIATDLTITGGTVARQHGEAPIFGQLAYGYDIARPIKNIDALPRVGVVKAVGGTPITSHIKGQIPYTETIASLNAAKNYATSLSLSIFDMGSLFMQGETNATDTKAYYQPIFQQLARDYATDRKAITGQTDEPALFSYVTCSNAVNTGIYSGVARAQFQASADYYNDVIPSGHTVPSPVVMTAPTYMLPHFFDTTGVHPGADGAYILGAYASLAQYHCYMKASGLPLSKRWPPIIPTAVTYAGGVATITYQMRIAGTSLAFGVANRPNGDGIPQQQDYGFAVWNGTALVSLASVALIGSNQVQITLTTGSFASGHRIGYGTDRACDHNFFFTGSAGNVRDNYGLTVRCAAMNWPMHNWLAPHAITLGTSPSWSLT